MVMMVRCGNCDFTKEAALAAGERWLCPMCDAAVPAEDAAALREVELRYPNRRILVVEDSRALRAMLKDVLEEAGFTVEAATDGEAALAAMRRERPDLVLLDVVLPKKDGFDVLREAAGLPGREEMPILMMSAVRGTPEDIRRMRELGANGFIGKDSLFETVLDRIHAQVARAA
jgi:DNA-binding response OmpR family regulator